MSSTTRSGKWVADLRYSADQSGITYVGKKPIHQYWPIISDHFRSLFLAPQRRSDGAGVSWSWRSPADPRPPGAQELAELRKRLGDANRRFVDDKYGLSDDSSNDALVRQVRERTTEIVSFLTERTDNALAAYVCRTENGLRLHSWGSISPAVPRDPAEQHLEISGVVLVSDKPSSGYTVRLENSKGLRFGQTVSDARGQFTFEDVAPGTYRVKVVEGHVPFPAKGLTIQVEEQSIRNLELRSSAIIDDPEAEEDAEAEATDTPAEPETVADIAPREKKRGSRLLLWLFLGVVAVVGAIWGVIHWLNTRAAAASRPRDDFTFVAVKLDNGHTASRGVEGPSTSPGVEVDPSITPARRTVSSPALPRASTMQSKPPRLLKPNPASAAALNAPPGGTAGGAPDLNPQAAGSGSAAGASPLSGAPSSATSAASAATASGDASATNAPSGDTAASSSDSAEQNAAVDDAPTGEAPSPDSKPSADKPSPAGDRAHTPEPVKPEARPPSAHADQSKPPTPSPPSSASPQKKPENSPRGTAAKAKKSGSSGGSTGSESTSDTAASPENTQGDSEVADSAAPNTSLPPISTTSAAAPRKDPPSSARGGRGKHATPNSSPQTRSPSAEVNNAAVAAAEPEENGGDREKAKSPADESPSAVDATPSPNPTEDGAERLIASDPLPPGEYHLHLSSWRARLTRDVIVPTEPQIAGTEESLAVVALRATRSAENAMPQVFRRPASRAGFIILVPASPASSPATAEWFDAAGQPVRGSNSKGEKHEIGWNGNWPTAQVDWTLVSGTGARLAQVQSDLNGGVVLRIFAAVQARFWIAVSTTAESSPAKVAKPSTPQWQWRTDHNQMVPRYWIQDDGRLPGHDARLEIPLDLGTRRAGAVTPLLVDLDSGWGLGATIGIK